MFVTISYRFWQNVASMTIEKKAIGAIYSRYGMTIEVLDPF